MLKREPSSIEKKLAQLVNEVKDDDISIYHVEYVKEHNNFYARVFADKESGISLDDLETLSRALSDKLDEKDFIKDKYTLEVSSPELDRALNTEEHFIGAIGEEVFIKTLVKVNGKKEHIGLLVAVDEQEITIETNDSKYNLEKNNITKAKVYFA